MQVIAHEMLNSFTPVGSLASTIKHITEDEEGQVVNATSLSDDQIIDINLAANTITKRSEGLLNFVEDYRSLSNLPEPQAKPVNLKEFIHNIGRLMKPVLDEQGVALNIGVIPPRAELRFDPKQIEQVLINLIGNSLYALEGTDDPYIAIECEIQYTHTTILVSDNGHGIPPEILHQVFVPFFTTRKHGSGIGLSLSKDIMKQHQGNLLVASIPGKKTTFSLAFPGQI